MKCLLEDYKLGEADWARKMDKIIGCVQILTIAIGVELLVVLTLFFYLFFGAPWGGP